MSFRLLDELQTKAVPVAQTCLILGVSRAKFYEAKRFAAGPMSFNTSVPSRAAFISSDQSYGSRRLVAALANSGMKVGRYQVRRLMQQVSLKPVWTRKFVHTTDLSGGAEHSSYLVLRCPAHGDSSAVPSGRTGRLLQPRQPICKRPVSRFVERAWLRLQQKPKRQLLR